MVTSILDASVDQLEQMVSKDFSDESLWQREWKSRACGGVQAENVNSLR
jgi:hypothetical protein